MNKILFFCNFPPPLTGQTIGSEVVFEMVSKNFSTIKFNFYDFDRSATTSKINFKHLLHTIKKFYALWKFLKFNNVTHIYFVPSNSYLGHIRDLIFLNIFKPNHKIIGHIRSGDFNKVFLFRTTKYFNQFFSEKLYKIIFLSEALAEPSKKFISENKIKVIYNTIDKKIIPEIHLINKKLENRILRQSMNVLFLSNIIKEKGLFDLLKALSFLDKSVPFNLKIIGAPNKSTDLKRMQADIKKYNLRQKTRYLGPISDRSLIQKIYMESDVFVLPTYYSTEAQPRSIIESLSCATPIIATDHAGIPEIFNDKIEGYIVPKRNPLKIANCINKLNDTNLWKVFAFNCRKRYEEKFSRKVINDELCGIF